MEENQTIDASAEKVTEEEFVQGFALSGEFVKELKDKKFIIVGKPYYESSEDLDKPGKMKSKLILFVKMADGSIVKYYPNKTSQKTIITRCGFKLDKWVGFKGEFVIRSQMVGNQEKQVIYIKE